MIPNRFGLKFSKFASYLKTMLIFLLGFMGSGKTHCGKEIAKHFSVPFLDLDAAIENAEKKTISELFALKGEAHFREIESAALRTLVQKNQSHTKSVDAVVSCGGGTPCFHENMPFMNQHGLTVWINPSVQTLAARLTKEQEHRPLIAGLSANELESFIIHKLRERESFYKQAILRDDSGDCPLVLIEKHLSNA
jgi:shikimate kinase